MANSLITIVVEPTDHPTFDITMTGEPAVLVRVHDGGYMPSILANDPEALRHLARTFEHAAVEFSLALDKQAARQINAQAGAA